MTVFFIDKSMDLTIAKVKRFFVVLIRKNTGRKHLLDGL